MNGELVSSAIAGGLGGVYDDFSEQRRLKAQQENAQIRAEIQAMIAQMNAGSRERVAETGAGSRERVADTNAGSRERVAETNATSRSTVADKNNVASLDRLRQQIQFGEKKLDTNDATTRRGQDISSTDRRYATDTGAATTRRGQDVGSTDRRRGQDLSFDLGADRNALTQRGQDIDFGLGEERNAANAAKRSIFDIAFPTAPPTDPAAVPAPAVTATAPVPRATLPAPVVKPGGGGAARGQVPITPRAASPQPAGGGLAALTSQAASTLDAYTRETNPAKKAALQAKLVELKKQRDALVAGGGG